MALGLLKQNVSIESGKTYRITFEYTLSVSDVLFVYQGTQQIWSSDVTAEGLASFVADSSGAYIAFSPQGISTDNIGITVDSVTLREVILLAKASNVPVKEFLSGTTDDDREIFFRADTPAMQFSSVFEELSTPLAVITKLQRGSLMKCYIALEDGDFYELEGTAKKGVSIIKIHAADKKNPSPPVARKIRVSWREGSKQLCRLTQGAIIFIPGTLDYSE